MQQPKPQQTEKSEFTQKTAQITKKTDNFDDPSTLEFWACVLKHIPENLHSGFDVYVRNRSSKVLDLIDFSGHTAQSKYCCMGKINLKILKALKPTSTELCEGALWGAVMNPEVTFPAIRYLVEKCKADVNFCHGDQPRFHALSRHLTAFGKDS